MRSSLEMAGFCGLRAEGCGHQSLVCLGKGQAAVAGMCTATIARTTPTTSKFGMPGFPPPASTTMRHSPTQVTLSDSCPNTCSLIQHSVNAAYDGSCHRVALQSISVLRTLQHLHQCPCPAHLRSHLTPAVLPTVVPAGAAFVQCLASHSTIASVARESQRKPERYTKMSVTSVDDGFDAAKV